MSEIVTKEDEEPVKVAGSKYLKDKDDKGGMVSALGDNGELLKEGSAEND